MDQNSSSTSSNPPQADSSPLDANQPTQTLVQPSTVPQNEPPIPQVSDPIPAQPQPTNPMDSSVVNASETSNYIDDVGYSLISLLDQINSDEKLIQTVANEMRLDTNNVKSILAPLLSKIDQGQITLEELALITAAPVVAEPPEIT